MGVTQPVIGGRGAVGWVYSEQFLRHDTGEGHVECPQRLEVILESLDAAGLLARMASLEFAAASRAAICAVHEPAYIEVLRLMSVEGFSFIGDRETRICPRSFDVATLAAGGVIAACDAVMAGQVGKAFCAVRPPGHHAECDQAMGFCLINNVAVGAEHLVRRHGLQRVAIVDFDVHHGNGTQHIFEARADVLYVSLHQRPGTLYPGTGYPDERGTGPGHGCTLNVPINAFARGEEYLAAVAGQVLPKLREYRPEFMLLSAGFDAAGHERMAQVNLEAADFARLTGMLCDAAEQMCGGRLVSVLEGGYHPLSLGACVAAHVEQLLARR